VNGGPGLLMQGFGNCGVGHPQGPDVGGPRPPFAPGGPRPLLLLLLAAVLLLTAVFSSSVLPGGPGLPPLAMAKVRTGAPLPAGRAGQALAPGPFPHTVAQPVPWTRPGCLGI
jgi:hypothetical protein